MQYSIISTFGTICSILCRFLELSRGKNRHLGRIVAQPLFLGVSVGLKKLTESF